MPRGKRLLGDRIRRFARRLLVVILILGAGGAWLWWAANADPSWWRVASAPTPEIEKQGDTTEMFVLEQLHAIREEQSTWKFRLMNEEMNAWLANNLPAWFEHETGEPWPDELSVPQVAAEEAGLNLGVQLGPEHGDRVITLRLMPVFEEDGVRLETDRVAVGKVALPAFAAESAVDLIRPAIADDVDTEQIDAVLDILFGRTPLEPVLELTDGRMVEVLGATFEPDGVVFECRTLRAGAERGPLTDRTGE